MEALLWLLAALAVVTLLGHGIWVAVGVSIRGLARLFRSGRGRPIPAEMCPRCGEAWARGRGDGPCFVCGWSPLGEGGPARASPAQVLSSLRRRVERYARAGLLSADDRDRILRALPAEEAPLAEGREGRRPEVSSPRVVPPAPSTPGPLPAVAAGVVFLDAEGPSGVDKKAGADAAVAARARAYQALREKVAAMPPPAASTPGAAGGRSPRLSALLAGFLEEKNIRWGELVGGLLIVGCSLALVISFWSSIAERPFLKFGLFNGVTALLYLLGFHAERRWALPTTARGLLVIATLLAPLDFLAVASMSRGSDAGSPRVAAGELAATGMFAWLTLRAGRSLVSRAPLALTSGVLVPSVAMLLIRRWVGPGGATYVLLALGALPLLAQAGALGGLIAHAWGEPEIEEPFAQELLRLTGLTGFAAALALGLLIAQGGPAAETLHRIAPLAPLAGASLLAPGLLLWRRANAAALVGYRATGTAVAAGGISLLLAGVVLAWPDPAGMLPVALLSFGVLTAVALTFEAPAAHVPAGACLVLAYLLGWQVATGRLTWFGATPTQATAALLSSRSGSALVPLVLLSVIVSGATLRRGRRLDAQAYALVAALAGMLSLALVTWLGFGRAGDPTGASWVYGAYAIAALASADWFGRNPLVEGTPGRPETDALAWLGSGLALAALVQGTAFGAAVAPGLPWAVAMLAHATLALAVASLMAALRRDDHPSGARIRSLLTLSAHATSIVAAALLVVAATHAAPATLASRLLWLSVVWLALAWREVAPSLFAGSQAALAGSVAFAVASRLGRQGWYAASANPWLDPWSVQAQALAMAGLCLAWIGVRLGVRARAGRREEPSAAASIARALLEPPWPAFDRFVRGAVVVALVALAVYGAIPGVAQELTPRGHAAEFGGVTRVGVERVVPPAVAFEIAGVPHGHALGLGSWAVLAAALAVLLAGQWERPRRIDLLDALVVASMAAPLAAGRWESAVSAASALRWAGAVVLLVTSALIWNRRVLAALTARLGWRIEPDHVAGLERLAAGTVIALAMLPLAALAGYVGVAALIDRPPEPGLAWLWGEAGVLFVIFAAGAIGLRLAARPGFEPRGANPVTRRGWLDPAASLLVLLGMLPLVAVSVFAVGSALSGNPVVGPEPGSFFDRIGNAWSYMPPILFLAATLVGFAVRERSPRFALAAGLVLNVAATTGYLLAVVRGGVALDATLATRLALLNAIVAAAYALAWMGAVEGWRRGSGAAGPSRIDGLLTTMVSLGVAIDLLVLVAATSALFVDPVPHAAHRAIAGPWGWSAILLVLASAVAWARLNGRAIPADWLGLGLLAVAGFLAMGLSLRDAGDWRTYHGLLVALAMAGGALPLVAWHNAGLRMAAVAGEIRAAVARWATVSLGLVVLFAIRGYPSDPRSSWWSVGALLAMALLSATLAAWSRWPGYVAVAGLLVNAAATCWWLDTSWWRLAPGGWSPLADILNVNVAALAAPVAAWLWLDRRVLRPDRDSPVSSGAEAIAFPGVASWTALVVLALVVAIDLAGDATGGGGPPRALLGWPAIAAVASAMAAGLWDGRRRGAIAGLYLLGLCASGWIVAQFRLPARWLAWTGTMVLAAYSVASSYLCSRRASLRRLADRLGIPRPEAQDPAAGLAWLVPANLALAAAVLGLAFGSILTDPDAILRSSAAHAALAETLSIGLLAQGARRSRLQLLALGVGVVGAIAWGWAWIAPEVPTGALDRLVVVLVALVAAGALYGLGLAKFFPGVTDWTRAARRLVPALLVLAAAALAVVFGAELLARRDGRAVAISASAIVAVAFALMAAGAAALVAAVVPGRDPLGLPERGRTAYVYGCEALLAILVLHLGLTMPRLFSGFFARYWALIVLGVAFLGAGLGELFRREGRPVLADPLERTGALLPLLPLLAAFWDEPKPGEDVVFLVLTGALYATLSLLRSSSGFAALAALAFNGALWTILGRWHGFGLAEHPQLWVVPPALCVLAGAYLNRDRLGEARAATARYAASLAIYLSSTADIVLSGVAQAPWLPLALAALSIAGILAGIALRVRGFLFLGLGFLTLALFAIVWYAAVDLRQTWLWAASGIVAGLLILAVFALFEKKRGDVLRVVERLKGWEP